MATEAVIFQQIVDVNWDQAIYTASPNGTINVAQFAAKGSGTNIGIALTPKGTGYISAQVPDGAIAGGNARGERSVDLQMFRNAATQVASGSDAFLVGSLSTASGNLSSIAIGRSATASGESAIAFGRSVTASGSFSIAIGSSCSATGSSSVSIGTGSSSSAANAVALGALSVASGISSLATGSRGDAYLRGTRAHGSFAIAEVGGCQEIAIPLGGKTTTNAEVILALESATKPILKTNRVWCGILHLTGVKSDGSAMAVYHRQVAIKRSGNNTTLEKNEAIGSDTAAGTTINITANDTDEALSVGVTGIAAETWRWVGVFHGAELAIGA